jgi:hypothetical protein
MRFDGKTTKQEAKDIKITKLSVVKRPAHEGALAKIIKSTELNNAVPSAQNTNKGDVNMDQKELNDFVAKQIADAVAPLQESLAKAEAMAKMTDVEKEYASTLDDEKKKEFMAMSPEKRKELMDSKKDIKKSDENVNEETFEMNGKTIKKSAVGEDVFFILKAQKEENELTKQALAKEKDAREMQELAKQAKGLYPNLPCKDIEKAAVLKAMSSMPESTKKTLETMLKAGDEGLKLSKAFDEVGYAVDENSFDESPLTKLNKMAEDIAEKEGVSYHTGYMKALDTPEGMKLYNLTQVKR